MSIASILRKEFKRQYSFGHVNLPLLNNPMSLGDIGAWGPIQGFRRSMSLSDTNVNQRALNLRNGPTTELEVSSQITIDGSLQLNAAGAGTGGAGKGSAKVTFHDTTSFYLFAPAFKITEYSSPKAFGDALWKASGSPAKGPGKHGVYRVLTVTSGIYVAARKANTSTTISATYTNPAAGAKADGTFTLETDSSEFITVELPEGEESVIAYDMVRWGVAGRVVVNPLT